MSELASILSSDFDHTRADFYLIDRHIYFGEMTFTSENGFVSSLFSEGLILLIIMLAAFLYLYIRMYKNKDIKGMIVLICVFAYLIAESFAPYFNKNLLWMMAIGYLSISPSNSEKDA